MKPSKGQLNLFGQNDESAVSKAHAGSQLARAYAQVLLDVQVADLKDRLFTYAVPESLAAQALIGAQVLVPFGRQMVLGYLVSLSNRYDGEYRIREIADVVDQPLFDSQYIDFLSFVADRYCASMQDVVASAIPSCLTSRLKRYVRLVDATSDSAGPAADVIDRYQRIILDTLYQAGKRQLSQTALRQRFDKAVKIMRAHGVTTDGQAFHRALKDLQRSRAIEHIVVEEERQNEKIRVDLALISDDTVTQPKTDAQRAVIEYLGESGGQLPLADVLENVSVSRAQIDTMVKNKMIQKVSSEVMRDALGNLPEGLIQDLSAGKSAQVALTDEQTQVLDVLFAECDRVIEAGPLADGQEANEPYLLHGVTGSGKTEVYLRLISRVLQAGKRALFLVPEISLTPQLSGRLKARFGNSVAVWHSAISSGERYDTWRRLRMGEVKVLLGARSAILAHIPDLGIIILDEEHDGSYKQSSPAPRYDARELAKELGRRLGAFVLMGSATPDVGSFYRANESGHIVSMPNRVFKQVMPKVVVVDMKEEIRERGELIISRRLAFAINKRLEAREQVVLLMNRRGFASQQFCQGCGNVVKCRNCSVSMTVHRPAGELGSIRSNRYLACHHCNLRRPLADACPDCHGSFLKETGQGTQKIENEMFRLFPQARVVRLDSDVTARKGAFEEILNRFAQGDADILIGTQMVAKGLDIANVTLVGVLNADGAFNLPDFRSAERGFQLITQVAGRAGRGAKPGEVVLQTYTPDLPALKTACKHDYAAFFGPELEARKDFDYPPFSHLNRIVVTGEDDMLAMGVAELLAEELSNLLEDFDASRVRILGPSPCLIEKIKNKFRYHLIVKNKAGMMVQKRLSAYLRKRVFAQNVQIAVDIDAIDMI